MAFSDFGDVESVLPVGVDLLEPCRTQVSDGVIVDQASLGSFGVDGVLEVSGRRQDAGVGDEAEAVGLHGLVFVVAVADFPADAMRDAGLKAGERLIAHADGPGRIVFERETDVLADFVGALTGTYERDELDSLRREWD